MNVADVKKWIDEIEQEMAGVPTLGQARRLLAICRQLVKDSVEKDKEEE